MADTLIRIVLWWLGLNGLALVALCLWLAYHEVRRLLREVSDGDQI